MIDDDVLAGRPPTLGTITTGYGQAAESQAGATYSRPTRSDTLVFHTNDRDVAAAVYDRYGGEVRQDSPHWEHDVVTAVREVDLQILPAGWRQALVLYRTADCVRKCDGVTMTILQGQRVSQPCMCEGEMARGAERQCDPSTVLPALIDDLDVERFGFWEIRSTGWGSARNLKGAVVSLAMIGIRDGRVPARLSMVDRKVRDPDDRVREVVDLSLTISASLDTLASVAPGLGAGDDTPPAIEVSRDRLLEDWSGLQAEAHARGLTDTLADRFAERYPEGGAPVADLPLGELAAWVEIAGRTLERTHGE